MLPLLYIRLLWQYRIVRWTVYLASTVLALLYAVTLLNDFGYIDLEALDEWLDENEAGFSAQETDFSATNPYRDLPDSPVTLNAIKETLYMYEYFNDMLLPTSLPGDDYELCSSFLRNLEIRTDLTWLVLHESGIKQATMAVAQRRDSPRSPVAEEPFDLQARFKALDRHWSDLESQPDIPARWEPTFDTQLLPPLLKAQPLTNDQATSSHSQGPQPNTLQHILTPEQHLAATNKFTSYLATRSHKVSYLKLHPPQPMAFAPVAKRPLALRTTWDTLFDDGKIEAGRHVAADQLADEQTWRPIYRSLDTENVPLAWAQPGMEDMIMGHTQEEWDADMLELDLRLARREERSAKVAAWQDEVRPVRETREKEEIERYQRERAEAEAATRKKQEL